MYAISIADGMPSAMTERAAVCSLGHEGHAAADRRHHVALVTMASQDAPEACLDDGLLAVAALLPPCRNIRTLGCKELPERVQAILQTLDDHGIRGELVAVPARALYAVALLTD